MKKTIFFFAVLFFNIRAVFASPTHKVVSDGSDKSVYYVVGAVVFAVIGAFIINAIVERKKAKAKIKG